MNERNNPKIVVTGVPGNVGDEVVRYLLEANQDLRALSLDPRDLKGKLDLDVECCEFDFTRESTFERSFENAKKMFLLRPPPMKDVKRDLFPSIDAAVESGIEHFVFLSLMGVNPKTPHFKVEKYLKKLHKRKGIFYTFLRPSFFMQNLNTAHVETIRDEDQIFLPAGKGKTSFIDVRDVGAITAKVLSEPGHENKAYTLTGNQALDYFQVATIFSNVLGREIIYPKPSFKKFAEKLSEKGYKRDYIKVMKMLYFFVRRGAGSKVTSTAEELLERKPTSFHDYVEDYAHWFEPNEN